jgi:NAD(P)H-hydrate epimerase
LFSNDHPPPALTSAQVREVDQISESRFGIAVDWLMEAAGWQIARRCRGRTAVLCGSGNNGGDGLAAARHLHRWGRLQTVACVDPARLSGPAARQRDALQAVGVRVLREPVVNGAQLVVDALVGTGLARAPEGPIADWIRAVNGSGARVVSVDVPSGLSADTGMAFDPAVTAHTTITLGLPKRGLLEQDGPAYCGEVWLADIGVPFEAYRELGLDVPTDLFADSDTVQLRRRA